MRRPFYEFASDAAAVDELDAAGLDRGIEVVPRGFASCVPPLMPAEESPQARRLFFSPCVSDDRLWISATVVVDFSPTSANSQSPCRFESLRPITPPLGSGAQAVGKRADFRHIGHRCLFKLSLYLNLKANLYDLSGRNPEICGRKIGIEMHGGK
jgi:hypothetical protein